MAEMEYGQQAIAAQEAAEFARAQEARMAAEKGKAAPAPDEETADEEEARMAAEEEAALDTGGMIELHAVPDAPADDKPEEEVIATAPAAWTPPTA